MRSLPADRFEIADVKVGRLVILIENLIPAIRGLNALAPQNGPEELDFKHVRPHAPEIEEAITPRFDEQERGDQKSHQHERQRRRVLAAERQRQRDARSSRTAQLVVASSRVRQTVLR